MKGTNQLILNDEELKSAIEFYLNSEIFWWDRHKCKVQQVRTNRSNTKCTVTFINKKEAKDKNGN